MERFAVGQRVRVNSGFLYGRIGTVVEVGPHGAFKVSVPGFDSLWVSSVLDVLANNGD